MEVAGRVVQSQESHPEQAESGDVTLASDPGSGTRGAGQSRGRGGPWRGTLASGHKPR